MIVCCMMLFTFTYLTDMHAVLTSIKPLDHLKHRNIGIFIVSDAESNPAGFYFKQTKAHLRENLPNFLPSSLKGGCLWFKVQECRWTEAPGQWDTADLMNIRTLQHHHLALCQCREKFVQGVSGFKTKWAPMTVPDLLSLQGL